jgi:hypothetical protein
MAARVGLSAPSPACATRYAGGSAAIPLANRTSGASTDSPCGYRHFVPLVSRALPALVASIAAFGSSSSKSQVFLYQHTCYQSRQSRRYFTLFSLFSKYYLEKFFFLKKYINFVLQMKKKLFFSALLLFCCGIALPLMAQMPIEVQTSALEKTMFANGKMNVVFSVVIIIVLGLLAYWLYLRRLISIYSQAISEQK